MIIGVGLDHTETHRIRKAIDLYGDRFIDRIFTRAEKAYCQGKSDPAPHYAARFAAKEACAKALGSGVAGGVYWHTMEVIRHPASGSPTMQLTGHARELAASMAVQTIHLSLTHTDTTAAAVVILYTLMGGLLADAWTDMIQGITLLVGLLVLAGLVLHDSGTAPFAAIEAERLQLFGGPETSWLDVLENWSIPLCGSVLAAELVARIIASRSPEVAQRSSLGAAGIYIAVGMIPVGIGLAGPTLLGGISDPEQVLPLTAQRYMPDELYLIFAGAMVAAILSTVDSALLVCGSLVSHNLVVPLMPGIGEAGKIRAARVAVALSGVAAYTMALYAEGVYALVEEASAFGSAGYFTVMVFALFTRLGGPASAAASLLLGMAAWIWGAYIAEIEHPYLVSLLSAAIAYAGAAVVFPAAGGGTKTLRGADV